MFSAVRFMRHIVEREPGQFAALSSSAKCAIKQLRPWDDLGQLSMVVESSERRSRWHVGGRGI